MGNFTYVAHDDDLVKDLAGSAITILTADSDYPDTNFQTIPMGDVARAGYSEVPSGNLVQNGEFEDDTDGWLTSGCTLASVAGGHSGNCLQMTRTGGGFQEAYGDENLDIVAGYEYTFSAWVKSGTSGNESFKVGVSRNGVEWAAGEKSGTSSASWVEHTVTFTAEVGISYRACLYKTTATAGTMLFDSVTISLTSPPQSTHVKIQIDMGSAKKVNFWSLLNHNIASGNPVIKTYDDAFVTASGETKTMTYRALDMYVSSTWTTAKRYYEIDLSACTFDNTTFFFVGRVIGALAMTTFTAGFSPGIDRGYGHENIINVTSFGVAHVHIKQAKINYLTISWDPHVKASVLTELLAFLDKSYGGVYPSIIIPDSTAAELYYMRCQDLVNWRESDARAIISGCQLRFKQLSRGKVQEG